MVSNILEKLDKAKSKKLKVTINSKGEDYNKLSVILRAANYGFEVKPAKHGFVVFIITTKWKK